LPASKNLHTKRTSNLAEMHDRRWFGAPPKSLKTTRLLPFARSQVVSDRIEPFEFGLGYRLFAWTAQYPNALTPRVLHVLILIVPDSKAIPLHSSDPVSRGIFNEGSQ
jgi:hypothetical protein